MYCSNQLIVKMRWQVWMVDMVDMQHYRVHVDASSREGAFIQAEYENVGCMAYDAEQIPQYDV